MKKVVFILTMAVMSGLVARGSSSKPDLSYRDQLPGMSWEEIEQAARREGQVSWYVWYFQPGFREQAAAFSAEYGIQVVIPEGDMQGNLNKARAEAGKTTGSIDLLAYGSDIFTGYRDLFAGPLDFLPGYEQRITELAGTDTAGYGLAYWGNQTGLAYDPDRVKNLPQTLNELESWIKQNPMQFAFNDPNGGGAGQMFLQSVIANLIPGKTYTDDFENPDWSRAWNWLRQNQKYYGITASNADSLTRLNDGEFTLVPAWEDHMLSLQNQGAIDRRFKIYIPKMGMGGGGNFTSVLKNAPHPAAALLFIHWLTLAETQTRFNQTFGAAPKNKKADDSFAAISNAMRKYSRQPFSRAYVIELKKQFVAELLSQ